MSDLDTNSGNEAVPLAKIQLAAEKTAAIVKKYEAGADQWKLGVQTCYEGVLAGVMRDMKWALLQTQEKVDMAVPGTKIYDRMLAEAKTAVSKVTGDDMTQYKAKSLFGGND